MHKADHTLIELYLYDMEKMLLDYNILDPQLYIFLWYWDQR